jgi:hypothetical protein
MLKSSKLLRSLLKNIKKNNLSRLALARQPPISPAANSPAAGSSRGFGCKILFSGACGPVFFPYRSGRLLPAWHLFLVTFSITFSLFYSRVYEAGHDFISILG